MIVGVGHDSCFVSPLSYFETGDITLLREVNFTPREVVKCAGAVYLTRDIIVRFIREISRKEP